MAENSRIEWTHHTFNPWLGCEKVSPACDGCYAESWAKRVGRANLWKGDRQRTTEAYWRQPLKWDREAAAAGERKRVFCASLADVFDNQVPPEWREDLWALIRSTPTLDWMLLTKRPQNMAKMLPPDWPLQNVWLGVTVENQTEANRRIPYLLGVPARVRFLSMEPLLGPVDLTHIEHPRGFTFIYNCLNKREVHGGIDLAIVGGESGGNARPIDPAHVQQILGACEQFGTEFFFKQWGEWRPIEPGEGIRNGDWRFDGGLNVMRRVGKKNAGREFNGRIYDGMPA